MLRFKYSRAMNTTRAQVLKHGNLKKLERGGIKAFIGKIAPASQDKKHIAIAQRKGKERLEINEKFSKSVPSMLGSAKHVYGKVEPYIGEDLTRNLEKFVKEALRR